ncbi:MAG TPA: sigma factor, partial [Holophagaceae bacterium]|nr:sigma factor [Holophagaceae bacterium]
MAAHLDALHGLALAWTHDGDWAGDLVQRTFLKAFERLGQLRAPEAARSWLITILRHERASDLRRQARFEVLE